VTTAAIPNTYRNAARGGPSHGHRGSAQTNLRRSIQRFQRYACGQTDTPTERRVGHNTPHPYRGWVIKVIIASL